MAFLLNGNNVAFKLRNVLKASVESFTRGYSFPPRLAIIQFNSEPNHDIARKQIEKACRDTGIMYSEYKFNYETYMDIWNVEGVIRRLNQDHTVHGILPLLPFPTGSKDATHEVINQIRHDKDVDCLTDMNRGKLYFANNPENLQITPCAASGAMYLASMHAVEFMYMNCVIVGEVDDIITKPLATMLLAKGATVDICHPLTRNLREHTERADVLFVNIKEGDFLMPEMVKQDAVIFNFGHGGVHPDVYIHDIATCVTLTHGGIWPVATTMLMQNTLTLARKQAQR